MNWWRKSCSPIVKRNAPVFLEISEHLLKTGRSVRFRATGHSMRPAIEDGDVLTVTPIDPSTLQAGDVILFRRHDRPIAHRVAEIRTDTSSDMVVVPRGDGKAASDARIVPSQILGRVVSVERQKDATKHGWLAAGGRAARAVGSRVIRMIRLTVVSAAALPGLVLTLSRKRSGPGRCRG